jgi:hypothetical protein
MNPVGIDPQKEGRQALLRLFLGTLQMWGAVTTLILLVWTGLSQATILVACLSTMLTLTSRALSGGSR